MTAIEQILTVVIIMAAAMLTCFIFLLIFPADKETPAFVQYLGKGRYGHAGGLLLQGGILPAAATGLWSLWLALGWP